MRIIQDSGLNRDGSKFDAQYIADSIAELDQQHASGDIEPHAYIIKKQGLVRLYMKATTAPRRRPRSYED